MTRRIRIWVALAAVAGLVQTAYVAETNRRVEFRVPVLDAAGYHNQAVAASRSATPDPLPYWQPPLYPWGLTVLYRLGGPNVPLARYAQVIPFVAAVLLTFAVARRMARPAAAVAASLAVALCGPLVFHAGELLPTALATALDALVLLLVMRLADRPCPARSLAVGLALGAAALAVPNILIVAPVLAAGGAWVAWRRGTWRAAIRLGLALAAGVALWLVPVAIRNRVVGGAWVPISTNAGINLYIGNNPDADRTIAVRPGQDWDDLIAMPYRRGATSAVGADAFYRRQVLAYAWQDPAGFAAGILRKARHLWAAREIPRNTDVYSCRPFSRVLRALVGPPVAAALPFALLGTLALYGLLACGWTTRDRRLLAAFVLLYGASVVVFFPTSRYRLPMAPALAVLAVLGVGRLAAVVRQRDRRWPAHAVALVLAGSFVCWPVRAPTDGIRFDAELHKNVGVGLQVRGLAAEALIQYELALALGPACEEAHYYQGTALRDVGRKAEAAGSFRRCLALRPDHAKAADDLAVLIVQQGGDLDEAERLLRGVLARDPNNARVQRNLGVLLAKRGRTAEAQEWLTKCGALPAGTRIRGGAGTGITGQGSALDY